MNEYMKYISTRDTRYPSTKLKPGTQVRTHIGYSGSQVIPLFPPQIPTTPGLSSPSLLLIAPRCDHTTCPAHAQGHHMRLEWEGTERYIHRGERWGRVTVADRGENMLNLSRIHTSWRSLLHT